MNIHNLKEEIKENDGLINLILEDVGFTDISNEFNQGNEFRCAWEEGGNPTSVRVSKSTLSANCFSRGIKGDIITLVQEKLNISFSQALNRISKIINYEDVNVEVSLPFGGFFNEILSVVDDDNGDIQTYDESILNEYLILPSERFLNDGICCDIQERYKVGYDVCTGRIIVPWRNLSGELVGIMGRLNKDKIEEYENKWFPIISFTKSKTLFGFSENYNAIQHTSFAMIGESEKFPMALSSKGIDLGLGLGGSSLSQFQANNIKSLFPKRILVCMDEGLDEDISRDIAKQLKIDTFFENEVGYIYDAENKYLPKGSKMSPSDLPLEEMRKLIVECSKKV
ncbi:hypothetical protein [Lysinibacillus fusiformis]|uniref:hypothetical protein n=1 Tax=Lysinibacillus fusiformis TaxID=28031 RepID=UPI00263B1BCA|nr:hypothetical protein [Lysinibacillus fusiformis]MDC6267235.1 hypothetical protein [Lysinibacillus sphaericus]MDN4968331.1 hypothetical protein [Lysinibacillus fusiformis]MDN4968505.1 hypothetical protein [Lysinibacillus fusiformis]